METRCTSDNREMILRVLQNELHEKAAFTLSPDFTCSVGNYSILRDGRIVTAEDSHGIFQKLAFLGLCDAAPTPSLSANHEFSYPVEPNDRKVLLNIFCMISARQQFLNRALAAKKDAFRVSPSMMEHLLSHPPITRDEFLQALYDRDREYSGIRVEQSFFILTGFSRCPPEEAQIHHQLADRIIHAARSSQWIKPYTRNVRNKKYAFRTWLNEIGMIGPEYEEARTLMLERLYGQSDTRCIRR